MAATGGVLVLTGQTAPEGCEEPPPPTTTTTTTEPPTTTTTTAPPGAARFSGDVLLPAGFEVPAGETWAFDPEVSTTVHVRANVVVRGTLQMRPARPEVVHALVFEGVNEAAFVGGGMQPLASDVGLWVVEQGVLDAVGAPKNAWTRSTHAIAAGATTFTVADAAGWRVGDTVVLTPSAPTSVSSYWNRYDTRTIVGLQGNTVQVAALTNAHPAAVAPDGTPHFCEVLNLTRNVRVAGTPSGRSHVAWMAAQRPVHISDVELAHLSVPNKVGRYAAHWHMMGDASQGSHISSVVAHDCGNHVFVPHASHGIWLDRCVSHNSVSDAYWWDPEDDGSLVNATDSSQWTECVASRVDGGYRVGGFNLGVDTERGRPKNTIRGCVATGVAGNGSPDTGAGTDSNDAAGYIWPELDDRGGAVWVFERNTAHNCKHNGTFVWQNADGAVHLVDDTTVYNCNTGINHGAYANSYRYRRGVVFACHRAIWVHAASAGGAATGQTYEDLVCAVTGPHAVNLNSVTAGAVTEARTLPFRRMRFRGHTGAAVRAWGEGGTPADDEFPGKWDFHDTDWDPARPHVVLTSGAPVGTRVRELVGGVVVATHAK